MRKLVLILAVFSAFAALPMLSHAQATTTVGSSSGVLDINQLQYGLPGKYDVASSGPAGLVANFYNFAILIGGLLAFGSILYGGILYLTTGGNTAAQHEAKERIRDAVIGLLLLLGIYLVLNIVNPDLTNLRFPELQRLKPPPTASSTDPNVAGGEYACITPDGKTACYDDADCGGKCIQDGKDLCVKTPGACVASGDTAAKGYGYLGVVVPAGTLADADARAKLAAAGISVNKSDCLKPPSDTCVSKHTGCESCTSLDGIPQSAIDGAIAIKNGCPGATVQITGGTEAGHATHGMGKAIMDFHSSGNFNQCVYSWTGTTIWSNYQKVQTQYGNFMWETKVVHWHVVF